MKIFEQFTHGQLDKVGRPLVDTLYSRRPAWTVASISDYDAAFFAGLEMTIKPKKIVEIGVASGWGSVILLQALNESGREDYEYHGVDISERFFYDANYATGQAVQEMVPSLRHNYHLWTGKSMSEVAPEIGAEIDFAFIDAHHMHPWATLDLLSVLPFMKAESWVAMHDLNLSRKVDQEHQNRGPKYLFEGWEEDKAHSIQIPTMAGAIKLGKNPADHLPLLLDILHTPWELAIEERFTKPLLALLANQYGSEWSLKFQRAIEIGNYKANKIHSRDIDSLIAEINHLRSKTSETAGSFLKRFTKKLGR